MITITSNADAGYHRSQHQAVGHGGALPGPLAQRGLVVGERELGLLRQITVQALQALLKSRPD